MVSINTRLFLAGCVLAAAVSAPAPARASGYEFDGVGARAIARGGAVIADATDWTAIYWNPANLTGVKEREAGLELKAGKSYTRDGNSFNLQDPNFPNDAFSRKKSDSSFFFGSLGAAVPLDEKSAFGVGVYVPLMQGSDFADTSATNAQYSGINYEGFASLMVANISYARKVSDRASFSLGANAIRGNLASDVELGFKIPTAGVTIKELDGTGYGLEGVFGAKYALTESVALGAVFRSGAKVKIEGDAKARAAALAMSEDSDFKFTLKQPPTSGIGAAWRYRDDLTFTCDFAQTWWKGFSNELTYDTPGTLLADQANTFNWKNSYKLRAGALWSYSENADLMAGYAYDTPAIDAGSIDFSTAIDVPMHRFSAAASRRWGPVEGTLAGLVGYNSRNAGGVNYRLGGWYFISELKYNF